MRLSDLVIVRQGRHERMVNVAGAINESITCPTYTAGFQAQPRSVIKLSITSLAREF